MKHGFPSGIGHGMKMMLSLDELTAEPYASIICYPRTKKTELKKRIEELGKLGVKSLDFVGEKTVFNVSVLGKGCVGIVLLAHGNFGQAALKIRRVDADRTQMQREAMLLQKANSIGVGPQLLGVSRNFLLMQYIEGTLFVDWIKNKRSKARIKGVLRGALEQCWRLDRFGLDHGELSHAPKHVIVNGEDKPFVVDFESASLDRKPSNATSLCQYFFFAGTTSEILVRKLGPIDRVVVVEALRRYKNDKTLENFERMLTVLRLQIT